MTDTDYVAAGDSIAPKESLDTTKLRVEIEKLRAEREQIICRTRAERGFGGWLREWSAILLGLVTVAGAGWGLYASYTTYWAQRQREHEFRVTQEVIALSVQLASADEVERANAALLLAELGLNAVPILVNNLRVTDRPGLARHLQAALVVVLERLRAQDSDDFDPWPVVGPLLEEGGYVLERELRSANPSIEAVVNHISALQAIAVRIDDPDALDRIESRLVRWKTRVETSWKDKNEREALEIWIDDAIDITRNGGDGVD